MDGSARFIGTYRAWDAFERAAAPAGVQIVDFDLLPASSITPFQSRREAIGALRAIAGELCRRSELLLDRVRASIAFLQVCMGELLPFDDYIARTLGVVVQHVAVERHLAQRSRVESLLDRWNIRYCRRSYELFRSRLTIQDDRALLIELRSCAAFALERVKRGLDLDAEVSCSWFPVRRPAYWKTWVSSRPNRGWVIEVNLERRRPFYRGEPLILAYHEVAAHALQMAVWSAEIRAGVLDPAFGITTVHWPEQFVAEGLALSITDCLLEEDELPAESLFAREYDRHRLFVYHDAHIDVNRGTPLNDVVENCLAQLPFETRDAVEDELRSRLNDPLLRMYQLAYSCGDQFFLDRILPLPKNRRLDLLRRMYSGPTSARELARQVGGGTATA